MYISRYTSDNLRILPDPEPECKVAFGHTGDLAFLQSQAFYFEGSDFYAPPSPTEMLGSPEHLVSFTHLEVYQFTY